MITDQDIYKNYHGWCRKTAQDVTDVWRIDYDDVVQELHIALWKASTKADAHHGGATATWLTQAGRFRVQELRNGRPFTGAPTRRGKRAQPRVIVHSMEKLAEGGDEWWVPATMDDTLERDDLRSAVQNLSPEDQALVYMRVVEDLTLDDIAGKMNLSRPVIRKRWNRALDQLRSTLEGDE